MASLKITSFILLCVCMVFLFAILFLGNGFKQLDYLPILYRNSLGRLSIYPNNTVQSQEHRTKSSLINHSYSGTSGHLTLPVNPVTFASTMRLLGIDEPWIGRLKRIQDICRSNKSIHGSRSPGQRFMFSEKNNFVFCKVPKTGCTFLTSLYGVLELGMNPENAFGINRDGLHMRTMKYLSSNLQHVADSRLTKIVVARDPYTRLFSGYMDKVYLFGFSWTASVVAQQSGKELYTARGLQCGYTTSFQDFLELFVSKGLKTGNSNNHWKPVYDMCKVCNIDFQLVLKTETLSEDSEFVIDHLKIDDKIKESLRQALHSVKTTESMIQGLLISYLRYQRSQRNNCPDITAYVFKLWKAFKILGYIKNSVPFPWTKFQSNSSVVNYTVVSEVILDTMRQYPLSASEKKKQKYDALVAAYKTVKESTIDKIKQYFKYDFLLFGYNENPPGRS